jgi:hypothetical protein
VQADTNKRFTTTQFCQILAAVPSLYTHEWTKLTGSQNYSLIIDVPDKHFGSPEVYAQREKALKTELLKISAE